MKISSISISNFKRFVDLNISDIPQSAKLVVLAGPNGRGKSSLFDALYFWQQINGSMNWRDDTKYYRIRPSEEDWARHVNLLFHGDGPAGPESIKKSFYFRSAYRNEAGFKLSSLTVLGSPTESLRFNQMADTDAAVSDNYARLVSQSLIGSLSSLPGTMTLSDFRDATVGEIKTSLQNIFPDLIFDNVGDPFETGTFTFTKGNVSGFIYKNLSGGEKAVFDLLLDIVVKKKTYENSIYCIDEPEAHMNTRLQGKVLEEIYNLIPENSQLWIATHSIGMMRKARELYDADHGSVVFLDFDKHDFENPVTMKPVIPNRSFWESVLSVALDDLASLVVPSQVILCEGNPAGPVQGKNSEFDADCYNTIFGNTHPDVKFISAGSSNSVAADRLSFAASLPRIAAGISIKKVIDRDDHHDSDVEQFKSDGLNVLSKRNIEGYLFDDEVLTALCESAGQPQVAPDLLAAKRKAIKDSVTRNFPENDLKAASRDIYLSAKQLLRLTGVGNTAPAFAKNTLAPLIKPEMNVYKELKDDIFGV